ncbi:MAG: VanZ family protein [Oscillospiraceae bacterium]|nr:VanZ family protein [Oscillospiraceae bacterium]
MNSDTKKTIKWLMNVVFLVYLLMLLRMTVFRNGFVDSDVFSNGSLNLVPFSDLIRIANNDMGVFIYLALGNIVVFMPFGFFIAWYEKNVGLAVVTLWGFFLSLGIELSQYVFGTGVTEIDDIILNTLGCLLGGIIERAIYYLYLKKQRKEAETDVRLDEEEKNIEN